MKIDLPNNELKINTAVTPAYSSSVLSQTNIIEAPASAISSTQKQMTAPTDSETLSSKKGTPIDITSDLYIQILKNKPVSQELVQQHIDDLYGFDSNGMTLIALSLNQAKPDMGNLELLLHMGAAFDPKTDGIKLLDLAVQADNLKMAKFLLKNQVDPNTPRTYFVRTATINDNYNMVDLLLLYHANLSTPPGFKGETALHIAARYGYNDIATLLLKYDASPDVENVSGKKPLKLAIEAKNRKTAEIIKNHIKQQSGLKKGQTLQQEAMQNAQAANTRFTPTRLNRKGSLSTVNTSDIGLLKPVVSDSASISGRTLTGNEMTGSHFINSPSETVNTNFSSNTTTLLGSPVDANALMTPVTDNWNDADSMRSIRSSNEINPVVSPAANRWNDSQSMRSLMSDTDSSHTSHATPSVTRDWNDTDSMRSVRSSNVTNPAVTPTAKEWDDTQSMRSLMSDTDSSHTNPATSSVTRDWNDTDSMRSVRSSNVTNPAVTPTAKEWDDTQSMRSLMSDTGTYRTPTADKNWNDTQSMRSLVSNTSSSDSSRLKSTKKWSSNLSMRSLFSGNLSSSSLRGMKADSNNKK